MPEEDKLPDNDWLGSDYLTALSTEKTTAMGELQSGTTWGLTLLASALFVIISREEFPDVTSLLGVLFLLVLATHFSVRTLKGYINVIRWALLQRMIVESLVTGTSADTRKAVAAVRRYHLRWQLPVRRRDVLAKGLVELGLGYLWVILVLMAAWLAVTVEPQLQAWLAVTIAVGLSSIEVWVFARSPYLRTSAPDSDARLLR